MLIGVIPFEAIKFINLWLVMVATSNGRFMVNKLLVTVILMVCLMVDLLVMVKLMTSLHFP